MSYRSKDSYKKQVYDFVSDILVVCPSCGKQALVKTSEQNGKNIKVVCTGCGFNKRLDETPASILYSTSYKIITGRYLVFGGAVDPYFQLPLWLTINCCDNILWAYNHEHLEFLKQHVEAKLRERNTDEISNKSLGSRLPKWMTSTKNKEAVLKAIGLLKSKV